MLSSEKCTATRCRRGARRFDGIVLAGAYGYWTDCVDDWLWGLAFGLLAFLWFGTSNLHVLTFAFPHGIDWQVALVAASGATAIFIGVRQFRRRRHSLW